MIVFEAAEHGCHRGTYCALGPHGLKVASRPGPRPYGRGKWGQDEALTLLASLRPERARLSVR